jgi:hypothetical protein
VQIQILLHLFRLCHPTPYPVPRSANGTSASPKKRKQRKQPPTLSLEDKLESLMDKLAMWQLLSSIDDHGINTSNSGKSKDDRDWMQIFCEDVVRETFVHSRRFAHSLLSADVRAGVLVSAICSRICANYFTAKSSGTPYFPKTQTRKLHQLTKNEKQSVKKLYQPYRLVLENRP